MKRVFGLFVLGAVALATIALVAPVQRAEAAQCVFCPQIAIECGPCYQLVHQTCKRCAYCKRIPGCRS